MGGADDRLAVAEAGDVDVQGHEAFQRPPGLVAIGVEGSEHHAALVLGDGVPGEQHSGLREVQGDAAWGVALHREHDSPAAQLQDVLIRDLLIDGTGWRRVQVRGDNGVQLLFRGRERGRWTVLASHERCVGGPAMTGTPAHSARSTAEPAWSSWK